MVLITYSTADKESASLTLSSNILTSGANLDLVNITDNAGTVIPTTKTVDLNKITFVLQGELPFALDTVYKFTIGAGFKDITGSGFDYKNTIVMDTHTYNYPATGGFAFNTANASTVLFDDVLAYKAIELENVPFTIDNLAAEIAAGACNVTYDTHGDVPDDALTVIVAIYNDDGLIAAHILVPEETGTVFTGATGATFAKLFIWDRISSAKPLCSALYADVE